MFELKIYNGSGKVSIILCNEQRLRYEDICKQLEEKDLKRGTYYIEHNGRLIYDDSVEFLDGRASVLPRVLGGKGGFGSMLRAIGAQIEKTTNREACRDLSGRRLRDINEEKRLKAWIEKQESRQEEEVARKKRKLEKLCATPKHEFKDAKYEKERSCLIEKVEDAVVEGLKNAAAATEARLIEDRAKLKGKKRAGRKTILDEEFDSDELESSEDSDDSQDFSPRKKLAVESKNSSSECSTSNDGSNVAQRDSDRSTDENSESSSTDVPGTDFIDKNVSKIAQSL